MLTVSNIAWPDGGDPNFLQLIANASFDGIDIAPTKIWPNWKIPTHGCRDFRKLLESYGLQAVGMQSLFYGAGPLNLFCREQQDWQIFLNHFDRLIDIANATGIKKLIFGAPTNRDPLDLDDQEIKELALNRLSKIGDAMLNAGLVLCIEPVPKSMGGKFLCTTEDTVKFLAEINHGGVKLNLDAAVLLHDGVDIPLTIKRYAQLISHVHSSEPGLGNFTDPKADHIAIASALREINYSGAVAIEMNSVPEYAHTNLLQALRFVKSVYG